MACYPSGPSLRCAHSRISSSTRWTRSSAVSEAPRRFKIPESVLVVIHTPALDVLLTDADATKSSNAAAIEALNALTSQVNKLATMKEKVVNLPDGAKGTVAPKTAKAASKTETTAAAEAPTRKFPVGHSRLISPHRCQTLRKSSMSCEAQGLSIGNLRWPAILLTPMVV